LVIEFIGYGQIIRILHRESRVHRLSNAVATSGIHRCPGDLWIAGLESDALCPSDGRLGAGIDEFTFREPVEFHFCNRNPFLPCVESPKAGRGAPPDGDRTQHRPTAHSVAVVQRKRKRE